MPHPALPARRALLLASAGALTGCIAPAASVPRVTRAGVDWPHLDTTSAVTLPGSHQFDIAFDGRMRRVFVALPTEPAPPDGYPVLYALDGNAAFPLVAPLARQYAARPGALRGVPPIVVGLGYPTDASYDMQARTDDYTLAPVAGHPRADRLLDFLEHGLRPWLARQAPLDVQRQTLFGHSYGGLFTLYTLFTRPSLFSRYVAASPSIWWGERAVLPYRDRFVAQAAPVARPTTLLVTAGSLEEDTPNPDPERARRQAERRQVSAARTLVQSLAALPRLRASFRLLDGEDHGSVMPRSAALAIGVASTPTEAVA
jgi:uncharacterized protein